ncbi:MAG: NAD(P)H-dependent oxidoreductase subunit E [Candidatus Saccharicenans sp.]
MKSPDNLKEKIDRLLASLPAERRHIILFLHRVQQELGYIPEEALLQGAEHFSVPPAEIYGLATFYSAFKLKPGYQHEVVVCQGTACHVRGAEAIKAELLRLLDIKPGENHKSSIALRTVNCLGCCAIAPVVVVDGQYQAKVNLKDIKKIIEKLTDKAK